jgi:hypothetical protein
LSDGGWAIWIRGRWRETPQTSPRFSLTSVYLP